MYLHPEAGSNVAPIPEITILVGSEVVSQREREEPAAAERITRFHC